jgi:integrase
MTANTMDALWAIFEPRRVKPKKTGAEYTRLYEALVRPRLGQKLVKDISFQDVELLHDDLRNTPYQANRTLALLRVMFKYAVALKWIDTSPAIEVKMFPEHKRRRHMRTGEAPKIARAIALREWSCPESCLFLWLIIFSGARSGEIADATWGDLDGNVLTLKEHKTVKKTGVDRIIVLPPAAMEKLDKLAATESRHPDRKIISISRPEVLWQRHLRVEAGCPDLRIHDLRHTFGTYALEKGYTLDQIGESLNHSSPTTTKIYAELTDRSRQRIANDVSLGILADMYVVDAEDAINPFR